MYDKPITPNAAARDGLEAPRVSPSDVEACIRSEHYFTAAEGVLGGSGLKPHQIDPDDPLPPSLSLLTFCILVLDNGFTIVGTSACISAANYDTRIGRRMARADAASKVWPFLGFRLADSLGPPPLVATARAAGYRPADEAAPPAVGPSSDETRALMERLVDASQAPGSALGAAG